MAQLVALGAMHQCIGFSVPDADDPQTIYLTQELQMTAREPHTIMRVNAIEVPHLHFTEDNTTMWMWMEKICHGHSCWTYIKSNQCAKNKCGAYSNLYSHCLSLNNVDNMVNAAELRMATLVYHGEHQRFPFERYVRIHVKQFNILESLKFARIDDRSHVRLLNNGIKLLSLDMVRSQMMASAKLWNSFDAAVTLLY